MIKDRPIGIFDSGAGGLSVLKEISAKLPNESIVFVGDTKNAPYGSKTKTQLKAFATYITNFLISKNVKAIVIACNTVCANCYEDVEKLAKTANIPIVGMIHPLATEIATTNKIKNLGILATEATVNSQTHKTFLKLNGFTGHIYAEPCPALVPLIEKGHTFTDQADSQTLYYTANLMAQNPKIESIILGCTHYPFLTDAITKALKQLGSGATLKDPAIATTKKLSQILAANHMLSSDKSPQKEFFVSGDQKAFEGIIKSLINENYSVQHLSN